MAALVWVSVSVDAFRDVSCCAVGQYCCQFSILAPSGRVAAFALTSEWALRYRHENIPLSGNARAQLCCPPAPHDLQFASIEFSLLKRQGDASLKTVGMKRLSLRGTGMSLLSGDCFALSASVEFAFPYSCFLSCRVRVCQSLEVLQAAAAPIELGSYDDVNLLSRSLLSAVLEPPLKTDPAAASPMPADLAFCDDSYQMDRALRWEIVADSPSPCLQPAAVASERPIYFVFVPGFLGHSADMSWLADAVSRTLLRQQSRGMETRRCWKVVLSTAADRTKRRWTLAEYAAALENEIQQTIGIESSDIVLDSDETMGGEREERVTAAAAPSGKDAALVDRDGSESALVFVGFSMGGVVVRHLLQSNEGIRKKTVLAVSIASPFNGPPPGVLSALGRACLGFRILRKQTPTREGPSSPSPLADFPSWTIASPQDHYVPSQLTWGGYPREVRLSVSRPTGRRHAKEILTAANRLTGRCGHLFFLADRLFANQLAALLCSLLGLLSNDSLGPVMTTPATAGTTADTR